GVLLVRAACLGDVPTLKALARFRQWVGAFLRSDGNGQSDERDDIHEAASRHNHGIRARKGNQSRGLRQKLRNRPQRHKGPRRSQRSFFEIMVSWWFFA